MLSEFEGVAVLKKTLVNAPENPGIYKMLSGEGVILYIGKAVNIRKRLRSYLNLNKLNSRLCHMVSRVRSVEFLITASEEEALLLEANLIRINKPRYNILLKEDKTFPYLFIDFTHKYPGIRRYRGRNIKQKGYFGPFKSSDDVSRIIESLQKVFLLRNCTDNFFATRKRPCIQYQIKRCSAPCVNYVTHNQYNLSLTKAVSALKGQDDEVRNKLLEEMSAASERTDYETALLYRDRLRALNCIGYRNDIIGDMGSVDADFIGFKEMGEYFCFKMFFFRSGRVGDMDFFIRNVEGAGIREVLSSFMIQFYQNNVVPPVIYVSVEPNDIKILAASLGLLRAVNKDGQTKLLSVEIKTPLSGRKVDLLKFINNNACDALSRYLRDSDTAMHALNELKSLLKLWDIPERIEIYDNSHISGSEPVAAMVVAIQGTLNKKMYRYMNASNTAGDDYAVMREVIASRLAKIKTNKTECPDLMIIDGGAAHQSVVAEIAGNMNLNIPFVCMSKGEYRNAGLEVLHTSLCDGPFMLLRNSVLSLFLRKLRDEAHRFAVSSHVKRRNKKTTRSKLDGVPGIGNYKKKLLLTHFRSVHAIANASRDELALVKGLGHKTADVIYNFFRAS